MLVGASKSISGFDPRSIPGCALWLDGADTATMNSTPTVTTWTDKSGQGNNVVGTATYSSGTITFNGTNQAFSNTAYVFPSNAYSMFAVYSNTTAPGATSYMNVVYGNGGYPMLGVYGSSKFVSARSVVANTGALSPNIVASNVLVSVTYAPSTFSPFINGSAETTLAGTTLAATGIYVGGPTNYFNGSVSEILIYSATLTQTQRQSVEGYLAWKWGINPSLPAIHPFYSLPAFSRPFAPTDIPGCTMWLDAADASTMNSTTTVTSWTDKSSLGNTMTGTATFSGSNMTFNGSTQAFSNTSFVFPISNYSMFAVYSNTTAPASTAYMNVVYGNGGYPMLGVYGSSKFVSARSVVANTGALSPNVAASSTMLVSATYTPSTFSPFINGSAETTLAGTTLAATGIYVSGPTNYFNGSVSEILIYNSNLSTTQRQQVEGYLAAKWGLLSSVVSGHPFKSIPPSTSQPPQFQEVTPGNWKYDWQPYLSNLAAANSSGVTVTTSTITGGATYITNGWFGAVVGLDGNVYFTPSNAANILKLNVATGVTTNITGGATYTTGGWCGGVLAPDGKIYFCPQNATNFLVLNTTTGVTSNVAGSATYTSGGWAGGLLGQDGNIYCCPLGANNILKLDPRTGVTTNITGGATYTGTGWALGQVGSDGNIYFAPVYATNYLKLNPITGVTTNVTGGATIAFNGYRGGTLGLDGNIYTAPYTDPRIMKLNTTTGVVSFITGGASMSGTAWQGGVLAADGNIYFIPNTASSLIKLNTSTNVTTNITGGATYTSQGWTCGVLAPDGNIYCSPYFSSSILKVTFSGLSQLPSLRYCVSPYPNHL
jgi:hypothetical protein